MDEIVVIGGGIIGLGLGLLLAQDGHAVTVLERDGALPPADAEGAWAEWERKGVNQFRLPHLFLPRFRQIVESELPEVAAALDRDGALRFNPLADAPEEMSGGWRESDSRYGFLSGRRAMVERAVASVAEQTKGLTIRRDVAVTGLTCGTEVLHGIPHINGVTTADGVLTADLVIDCSGRRSTLPTFLEAVGARRPIDRADESGFLYMGRHFRSANGELPAALGPPLQAYGSISVLLLPADHGTWSVTLVTRADDRTLLGLKEADRWHRAIQSLPTAAHWLDGEPLEDRIALMLKIEDRHRDLMVDGTPVATGLVAVADAWACTNPSVGRGASIGMLHAQTLRDTLRVTGLDQPAELCHAFADATTATVEPWFEGTLSFDRHRLAEMAAIAQGEAYDPGDPEFEMSQALGLASSRDPDVFRAFLDIVGVLELSDQVMARPGLFEKVIALGADWRNEEAFGPSRDELVALANS
jgi:2-polyprenyl-6-methoxyphenol hydroxylase-like FAD-dependent oxidoreductase